VFVLAVKKFVPLVVLSLAIVDVAVNLLKRKEKSALASPTRSY